MIKFASVTLIILLASWYQVAGGPHSDPNSDAYSICIGATFAWIGIVGGVIAWKILLVMVRQLGSAVRGK